MKHPRPLLFTILLLLPLSATTVAGVSEDRHPTDAKDLSLAWANYLSSEREVEPSVEFPFEECFRAAAREHELPRALLLAVARGESNFDPRAVSHANAHGLMQILWPVTARHLGFGSKQELYDPCRNVDAGARYLRELLDRYGGDLHLALAAYNYGPARIDKDAGALPRGALWYSDYIYNHLRYVLGSGAATTPGTVARYEDEGQVELVVFNRPYRAAAFSRTLQGLAPGVRIDWFRTELSQFRVVLLFADETERNHSTRAIQKVGFKLERR